MPRFAVLIVLIAPTLSGCLTIGGEPRPLDSEIPSAEVAVLSDHTRSYRLLDAVAVGQVVELGSADMAGTHGFKLARRYFSASGKRCLVARDLVTGAERTYCQAVDGEVNVLDELDMRGDRADGGAR